MKILFISTEIPYPPVGGHSIRTFNILKILSNEHKIFFIGFAQEKHHLKYAKYIEDLCEEVYVHLIPKTGFNKDFLFVVFKNLFSKLPLTAQRYNLMNVWNDLHQVMTTHQIDLVHIDMLAVGFYQSGINNLPIFLTNQNVEYLRLYRWMKIEKNYFLKLYLFLQVIKLKRYEKYMCTLFDKCFVVSENDKKYLVQLCNLQNASVIPNGVDIDYYRPLKLSVKSKRLIWVGGMSGPYNADAVNYFLDDIYPLIKQKCPDIIIDFIGGNPTSKLLKISCHEPNINILGFVDDIRTFVQRASLFIAPIRSGSGTKIKVLNAMAQGKAVIATPVAAEGIDVVNGHDIVIANNATDFALKTITLLKNPNKITEIGNNARRLIETKYTWDVIGKKIKDLYNNQTKSFVSG